MNRFTHALMLRQKKGARSSTMTHDFLRKKKYARLEVGTCKKSIHLRRRGSGQVGTFHVDPGPLGTRIADEKPHADGNVRRALRLAPRAPPLARERPGRLLLPRPRRVALPTVAQPHVTFGALDALFQQHGPFVPAGRAVDVDSGISPSARRAPGPRVFVGFVAQPHVASGALDAPFHQHGPFEPAGRAVDVDSGPSPSERRVPRRRLLVGPRAARLIARGGSTRSLVVCGGGGARAPVLGPRREGGVVRLAQQLERFLGGGAAVLVRVHEQRQPPELLLDGGVRGGGVGAYAEDGAPFVIGAGAGGRRGEEDLVCGERVGDAGEGRAEPLGLAGQTVRAADVARAEELVRALAGLRGLLSFVLRRHDVRSVSLCRMARLERR
jgi:hypothetical protein